MTTATPLRTLFLCTGNSARSILAEGILRHHGGEGFRAYSAGSNPTGMPNPFAIATLRDHGINPDFAASKSWLNFSGADVPAMDLIVTVCDNAAGETCPIWPGHPAMVHWGVPDPAAVIGDDAAIAAAFAVTFDQMHRRITALLAAQPTRATIAGIAADIAVTEGRLS